MEDQAALDELREASRRLDGSHETPGEACAGLLALIGRYSRLLGFGVLVGLAASWTAAVAVVGATMVFRYGNRGGLRKYSQVLTSVEGTIRRGVYLRGLALGSSAAKELRVFGMTPWLSGRYARNYLAWLRPLWQARRRVSLYPYLGYTTLGLAVAVFVFVLLARGAAASTISLTGLALGLQATMAALLLGEYYPESDDATQSGMLAVSALARFEAAVAALGPGPVPVNAGPAGSGAVLGGQVVPASPASAVVLADPARAASPAVRFSGVCFRYPGSACTVLDGLDLELPAGQCTAVVGINGAGKTTLVKLLTRLYEPDSGCITFGGLDIRGFDVAAWRRQVSVIFQDFIHYELPVADNIAFGAVHLPTDPGQVRHAADRAGLAGLLDTLPAGLDTPLGPYRAGAELSGGQWQRIAIARSVYGLSGGARVLVLDEPTAALDVRAEAQFFEQFIELVTGVTALLISHRFSTVRHADNIAVIDGGRVVEQGSHDELMAAGGRYAELFQLQAERFTAGPGQPDGNGVASGAGAEH
jgi:ATP-binding cassette subfamily B protein